jgi:hypothetical protein
MEITEIKVMLTIMSSQSGLLLCKFINAHLFLGGERRLGQSAAHTPGTAQEHPRTPIEAAPIFPLLQPATQLGVIPGSDASKSPDDKFRVPTRSFFLLGQNHRCIHTVSSD